jgi:hypothetical protein
MAAKKGRFRGARHAPKRLESDILKLCGSISDDPGMLRPKCAGNCRKCHFDKTFASLGKLERFRGNAAALNKMGEKGSDDIFKAVAVAMSLHAQGSIPYMTSARIAGETIPFAVRGRMGNDKLIAIQHYNDPKLRLMLYSGFARKKGLHIYSFDDEVVCSDAPNMPVDYLYDTFWETPYEFPEDGLSCGHDIEGVLVIRIKSLNEEIRICKNCAKDISTIQYLISRQIASDPVDDIEVFVEHKYSKDGASGKDPIIGDTLREYIFNKLNDRTLIASILREKLSDLKKHGSSTYIVGSTNFGSDLNAFMEKLNGTELEKNALKAFLDNRIISLVIGSHRATEALGNLWDENYRDILAGISTDDIATGMGDVSRMNPSQMLTNAHTLFISKDVVSKLPDFPRAGTVTKNADKFAKAMKVGGWPLLKKEVESASVKDHKSRSIARAFILSASSGEAVGKFSAEEEDFAKYLKPFVDNVIAAEGEKYRDAMNTLLTASGSGESV